MTITGPVSGVTPAVGASPPAPVANGAQLEAQLAAQLAAALTLPEAVDPSQAAARAIIAAREQAAERQGAMAPLLADLSAALEAPSAPPQVKAAIAQVLALRTPATPTLDGPALQRAVAQSGLMLEARLASATPGGPAAISSTSRPSMGRPPPAPSPTPRPSRPNSPGAALMARGPQAAPPADLKAALLTLQSALKASGPAPPARAPGPGAPAPSPLPTGTPPPPARGSGQASVAVAAMPAVDPATALEQLPAGLGRALDAAAVPAPLKAAVAQALASPHPAAIAPLDSPALHAAITRLQQALAPPTPPQPGQTLASDQPGAPPAVDLKAALVLLQGLVKALPGASAPTGARRAAPPPPPTRDGDLAAQAVVAAADLEPEAALERLPAEVDQTLARQTLHQLASTPDGGPSSTWVFELPLLTAQGQTVAQFAISRDGSRGGPEEEDDKPAWRARFALDVPPLGKVHVHLRMEGERSSAVLWAEQGEALERLRAGGGLLAGALGGEVVVHPGAPRPVPPAAPGQFVDQRS